MGGDTAQQTQPTAHRVIEALYDLPLGGTWGELQKALCAFWAQAGDEPRDSDINLLERHFQRALSFLEQLPAQQNAWRNALYRMPVPAAVFSRQGELVDANDAAREQLGADPGELSPLPEADRTQVRQNIRNLETQPLVTGTLSIGNSSATRILISDLPSNLNSDTPLYLAVMISNALPAHAKALMIDQFGLTPSEAQLSLHLSGGASLDHAADQMGVRKSTARTHLANTFGKLGVNSQPELVSLVLHSVFAAAHLALDTPAPPHLTPYLDPELHGYPRFSKLTLPDSRQLGYFEYGDLQGIPAIYLHGSLDSALFAKSQRLHGNGVRLIAPERPGVGESTFDRDVTPDSYARDLMHLADHLCLDEYAVIGRSMGSWDATALAVADPRARLLVMVSGRLPVASRDQINPQLPIYKALFNSVWHSATMGRLMLRAMQLQLMVKGPQQFMPEAGLPDVERALVRDPTHQRHMRAVWLRSALNGPEPTHIHLRLYQQPVQNPIWEGLQTPTLLIHGAEDPDAPLEQLLEQTSSFARREVSVLPGIAHRVVHVAMGEVLRQVAERWQLVRPTAV